MIGNRLAKTLYHGTLAKHEASIRHIGLVGTSGDFINEYYYDTPPEDQMEVVFAADKQTLGKAVTAMVFHVGKFLGKDMHDVTEEDIINNGMIVVIKGEDGFSQHKETDYDSNVRGAEPEDWYTEHISPRDIFGFIKGKGMTRLLRRYGQWPLTWGFGIGVGAKGKKQLQGEAVNYLMHVNGLPFEEAMKRSNEVSLDRLSRGVDRARNEKQESSRVKRIAQKILSKI